MSFVWDFWHQIHSIVSSWDLITMGIVAVVILLAGIALQSMSSLLNATLAALVGFGVAGFIRGLVSGGKMDASTLASTTWHNLMAVPMSTALAYAVCFAVLIAIIHVIRNLITGS